MPLLDVQRRFRELGRIRMGTKATAQNGRSYPKKLSEWRLTSTNGDLLAVAADVYGGTVQEWTDAPTEGKQWELLTGTDRLDVLVPPGEPLTQHWEMWSGGGCVRRCNGHVQQNDQPCACPSDLEARAELAKKGNACKATTRLSIVLPRIPDIGVWRVESHGMNAAVELPGTVDILRSALDGGALVPAQLRIEQRTSKKDGETRHFIVPVLELPAVTTAELMAGNGTLAPVHSLPQSRAIGSGGGEHSTSAGVSTAAPARSLPPLPAEVTPCPCCEFTDERLAVRQHLIDVHGYVPDSTGKAHPPPAPVPPHPPADNGPRSSTGAGHPEEDEAAHPAPSSGPSTKQLGMIGALLGKLDVPDSDRHRYVSALLELPEPVTSMKHLTKRQASAAIDALQAEAGEPAK